MIAAIVAAVAAALPWLGPLLLGGGGLAALFARPLLGRLFGKLGQHRGWLTMLAVAAVAAFLWAQYAHVRSERDSAYAWRERTCATVGVNVKAPDFKRGQCIARVTALATFERDTLAASNSKMGEALEDGRRRSGADLVAARDAAREARAAAESMEKANASITDDRVGGDWFAALNRTGGLRAPGR